MSATCACANSKKLDFITREYVKNHKPNNIRFPSKVSFPDYDLFEKTLSCASMIRDFGDAKYWSHSWEYSPEESDGLIEDIISAYWRHFLLWSNGIIEDESGHHHLTHMACRVLMMVTRLRRILTPSEYVSFVENVSVDCDRKYKVNLSQITTEIFTSMMLFNTDPCVNDSRSFLTTSIKKELIKLVSILDSLDDESTDITINPYSVTPADKIFYYTTLLINTCTDELLDNDLKSYKKEDKVIEPCSIIVKTVTESGDIISERKKDYLYVPTETPLTMYTSSKMEEFMKD